MYATTCTWSAKPSADGQSAQPGIQPRRRAALKNYKSKVDKSIKYIPDWVKVAVALALGLGTMVGWKRVVVTVGEKIGKEHLTYAQGASAGLVAMGTIFAGRQLRLAGEHHAYSQFRRGRHDGRQRQRPALAHGAQHRRGLGAHYARGGAAVWLLYWLFRRIA